MGPSRSWFRAAEPWPSGAAVTGPCLSAEVVAAYAAGELTERELDAVEAHIDGCSMCRQLASNAAQVGLSAHSEITLPG